MTELADHSSTKPESSASRDNNAAARLAELLVAGAVIALGAVILWQTGDIRETPTQQISARLFPRIVGVGTVIIGIWYAVEVLRGGASTPAADADDVDPTLPTDWQCVGFIGFALVAYLLLIERAGFIIASVALFVIAAYGMGSRRYLRDLAIAILLAVAVYYGFTEGLSVRLPAGVLEDVL
jgi:putative tricarboxylic transport membrane protein